MTFASGLRSILRQDPDVIMVGEIRDRETANIAVQAALTGHRVLSTVHTNDSAGAITRFVDMGIEPFLVASVMLVSFAQRLVRRVCPNCSEPYQPAVEALDFWSATPPDDARFLRGRGCFHCQDTGYRGRIGIYEILLIDDQIRDMVVRNCASHEITRSAHEAGHMRLLKEDAFDKVVHGITSMEEAASAVMI
jgi:type IV pilus assembly protein PilB